MEKQESVSTNFWAYHHHRTASGACCLDSLLAGAQLQGPDHSQLSNDVTSVKTSSRNFLRLEYILPVPPNSSVIASSAFLRHVIHCQPLHQEPSISKSGTPRNSLQQWPASPKSETSFFEDWRFVALEVYRLSESI